MDSRQLRALFVVLGVLWLTTQVILVRELLVVCLGNELFVGLMLAIWLAAGAFGSLFGGFLAGRVPDPRRLCAGLLVAQGIWLPFAVALARTLGVAVGLIPGEAPGVGLASLLCVTVLAPPAVASGFLFALGSRLAILAQSRPEASAGTVYVWESLGAAVGSVVLTLLVLGSLDALQIALLLAIVGTLTGVWLHALRPSGEREAQPGQPLRLWLVPVLTVAAAGLLLVTPLGGQIAGTLREIQWGGRELLFDGDSAYGNVSVVSEAGQRVYLTDGVTAALTPYPDVFAVESLVHVPMLFLGSVDDVLVIGGGIGGVLAEIEKYPVRHIDYVELDPLLLAAADATGDSLALAELRDPRLEVHAADGRQFVRTVEQVYDLVLVGLPLPGSLSLNRFYTREFYASLAPALTDRGMVVVTGPEASAYFGGDSRSLGASILAALKVTFSHVRAIPGDTVLFLASSDPGVARLGARDLAERLARSNIPSRLVSPAYLAHLVDPRREAWLREALSEGDSLPNEDLHPRAVLASVMHAMAADSPSLHGWAAGLRGLPVPILIAALGVAWLVLGFVLRRRSSPQQAAIPVSLASTGFAVMAITTVLLLCYQTFYGVIYREFALFTGVSAGGLCLGAAVANRMSGTGNAMGWFAVCEAGLAAVCGGLALGLPEVAHPGLVERGLLLGGVAGVSALAGLQFPLAVRIRTGGASDAARTAGLLYGADLAGACLGAAVGASVLLPTVGAVATCVSVAGLKLASLVLLIFTKRQQGARGTRCPGKRVGPG